MDTVVDCLEYGSRGRPLSTRSVDSITAISHGKAFLNIYSFVNILHAFAIYNSNFMKLKISFSFSSCFGQCFEQNVTPSSAGLHWGSLRGRYKSGNHQKNQTLSTRNQSFTTKSRQCDVRLPTDRHPNRVPL